MKIIEDCAHLASHIMAWKKAGETISFVPTMGFFHEGHLALMRMAKDYGKRVVVSVFVNPKQFGPGEDLEKYPRDLARDIDLATKEGIDLLFIPRVEEMYPHGYQTIISVAKLSKPLCGKTRPNHFTGVATVVAKLFNLVQPDVAVFGQKDYQQLALIRQMSRDLQYPIAIIGHPIIREPDGLAMSSRNKYLSAQERRDALCLYRGLQHAQQQIGAKKKIAATTLINEVIEIVSTPESCRIDYIEIVDSNSLEKKEMAEKDDVMALAAFFNEKVRLIDNVTL